MIPALIRTSKSITAACVCIFFAQSCGAGDNAAPPDAVLLRTFQDNRTEFEYWKTVFSLPGQNCRIETEYGFTHIDAVPCSISDWSRLVRFVEKTGVIFIEARSQGGYNAGPDRFVVFGVFRSGMLSSGQGKFIQFVPKYRGALQESLDKFSWRSSMQPDELSSGTWVRKIGSGWYLSYTAG